MLKTNQLIDAMRREKLARQLLSEVDWPGLVDLLQYRGYNLRQDQQIALIGIGEILHTGTIVAARKVLVEIGDRVIGGNTTQRNIITAVCTELVGLTAEALLVDDTLSRVLVRQIL